MIIYLANFTAYVNCYRNNYKTLIYVKTFQNKKHVFWAPKSLKSFKFHTSNSPSTNCYPQHYICNNKNNHKYLYGATHVLLDYNSDSFFTRSDWLFRKVMRISLLLSYSAIQVRLNVVIYILTNY